jgi:hypothetical protein
MSRTPDLVETEKMDFVLSRERRDEILTALRAIQRHASAAAPTPTRGFDPRAYVIGTNAMIIEACLTNLPRADPS